jgi:hypothetical protein
VVVAYSDAFEDQLLVPLLKQVITMILLVPSHTKGVEKVWVFQPATVVKLATE